MSGVTEWRAIRGRPCALAPECCWSVDWEVRVHYEKPDALIDGGEEDFLFVDRHVRPRDEAAPGAPSREMEGLDESPEGCSVSAASMPRGEGALHGGELVDSRRGRTAHQRDWDFLVEARDTLLARAGSGPQSAVASRVDALAAAFADGSYILRTKASFTRGFHPVDVLLHGQHCTGQSSALAALCHTMGVPARTLSLAGHSVCEVFVGGKWLLYDNQVEQVSAGRSYMEEVADPGASRLSPRRAQWYHWLMNTGGARHLVIGKGKWPNAIEAAPFNVGAQRWWRFNAAGLAATQRVLPGEGGYGFTLPLSPDTARALYPGEPRYLFKCNSIEPCRLTLNLPHGWFLAPLVLRGPAAVRKAFWLGDLSGATRVTAFLACAPATMWRLRAPFDSAWQVSVNGRGFALSEAGLKAGFVPHGFEMQIPMGSLREGDMNEIEFGCCRDNGEEVALALYPELLDPYVPPYRGRGEARVDARGVVGVHAADAYASHIPV